MKLRRFTFFIVNAERNAEGDWALKEAGPDGPQLIEPLLGIAVNAPKRAAADAFAGDMERLAARHHRLALLPHARTRRSELGAGPNWKCGDVDFRLDMISFGDLATNASPTSARPRPPSACRTRH